MNALALIGVVIISAAAGAMALAFVCLRLDGSGEALREDKSVLDLRDDERHNGRSGL